MSELQSTNKPAPSTLHGSSLIQLILSLLAAFILIGAAVVIVLSAIFYKSGANPRDPTEPFMVAASLAFAGILVLPSAWYSWRHVAYPEKENASHPKPRRVGLILTIIVIVLVGAALWLGNWSSQNNYKTWLLLPPLNIIATGLPALWVIYIGTRGLIPGAPRRKWGVFATGLVLGPVLILGLEIILLVLMGIIGLIWIMLNPNLANQLNGLVYRLQTIGPNLDAILKLFVPFLLNPGIIFLIFAFISVLVPLLEEALKPIGVWFLVRQKITPAQGFAYGVLSGAGFGLFENLGNTSGGATDWAALASTRISTLLLHSFTAGLMGWALVLAWNERRYIRLAIIYIITVIIHGLWNGLAILTLASTLPSITDTALPPYLQGIGVAAALGVVALGIMVFILYFVANITLQRITISSVPALAGGVHPSIPMASPPILLPDDPGQAPTEPTFAQPTSTNDEPIHPENDSTDQHFDNNSKTTGL